MLKIARLDEEWVVTGKVIDLEQTVVRARLSELVPGDVTTLLRAVPELVGRLMLE